MLPATVPLSLSINNSKVVWAVTMLVFNLGSRYVLSDISVAHERVLSHALFKRVVVVCMFFVATRDVVLSIVLAAGFFIFFNVLVHEGSRFCILPLLVRATGGTGKKKEGFSGGGGDGDGQMTQRKHRQRQNQKPKRKQTRSVSTQADTPPESAFGRPVRILRIRPIHEGYEESDEGEQEEDVYDTDVDTDVETELESESDEDDFGSDDSNSNSSENGVLPGDQGCGDVAVSSLACSHLNA